MSVVVQAPLFKHGRGVGVTRTPCRYSDDGDQMVAVTFSGDR